jgi:hypothetical protein
MSGEHREAVGTQAHPAQSRTLGELGHEPEHGTSPPTSPASAAGLSGAAPGTHAQAAAEVVSTPAQSHTIKVPPREEVLATRVAPRRRRRMRPVVITAGLLTTLGLGWTGGMNAERLASLDLPGRAAALATAAAHETWTWLQTAADAVRAHQNSKEPGGTTEGSVAEGFRPA